MDAVSGSLRIIDAANATHTVLDSRNYTNYTINHTKSGINNIGFVGVINGNNLYHHTYECSIVYKYYNKNFLY